MHRSNPIVKVRLLNGVFTGGYALFYKQGFYPKSMKGGVLMKVSIVHMAKKLLFAVFVIIITMVISAIKVQ